MIEVNKDGCLGWLKIEPVGGSCPNLVCLVIKYRGGGGFNVSAENPEVDNLHAARFSLALPKKGLE